MLAPQLLEDVSQLGQRESRPYERGRQAGGLEIGTSPLDGVSQYSLVVEGQIDCAPEHFSDRPKSGFGSIGSGNGPSDLAHNPQVRDRHHVHTRVPIRVAVGTELGKVLGGLHTCLLSELASSSLIEGLLGMFEPTRQCPLAGERIGPTLDQEHLQLAIGDREDNHIDSDRESWKVRRVIWLGVPTDATFASSHSTTVDMYWWN